MAVPPHLSTIVAVPLTPSRRPSFDRALIAWVGAMRCMVCGGKMELVQAVPDRDMVVVGYERHTLQCPECGEQEHRLVFKAAQPPVEVEVSRPAPSVELSAPPSEIASAPAPGVGDGVSQKSPVESPVESSSGSPIGAWARAIKKLHDQQDELRERAKLAQADQGGRAVHPGLGGGISSPLVPAGVVSTVGACPHRAANADLQSDLRSPVRACIYEQEMGAGRRQGRQQGGRSGRFGCAPARSAG